MSPYGLRDPQPFTLIQISGTAIDNRVAIFGISLLVVNEYVTLQLTLFQNL